MFKKLRGWFRLYILGVCPHCKGDQPNACPMCRPCRYIYESSDPNYWGWPLAQYETWNRYMAWLDSK